MSKKLRVGISSSYPFAKTGFSRHCAALIPYLYRTDKYELFFLAHSMQPNHPDFQRAPWVTEGVFRNFDQQRFDRDDGYKRLVAYGNTATEDFIVRNKLDVFIACEDPWAFDPSFFFEKPWYRHIQQNFLPWFTADSLPILPLIKDWANKCPNLWLWSSFAEEAMKKEDPKKFGHVKTVHGTLDASRFNPISQQEKAALRQQFNIAPNETIILYLGRNQLRKLFWAHMEALAKLKKFEPNYKVRLLFHCFWAEQMGWPLERIREECGLAKEDILTTYNCVNCGFWEIKPYEGEFKDCQRCGTKGRGPQPNDQNLFGKITAGVGSSISEEDLSKIYGIADGACSVFTSGGLEFFNVESLLCGLPLASSPYSSGVDFVKNDFVFPINGQYTRECQTGFKKFVPNINDIVKFYKRIADMPLPKRLEIGRRGREWALNTFNVDIIGKKVEDFIDACKPLDWEQYEIELKKDEIPRNPAAIIPQIQDNKEWVLKLYKDILIMSPSDDDSGLIYWLNALAQGMPRENVEGYFRKVASDKNLEINQMPFESVLIKNGKKNFLLVACESAGDILYIGSCLKSFRENYKEEEWNLYFATKPEFQELVEGNPYISKIIPYIPFMDNEIVCLGAGATKGNFQGYCFATAQSQRFLNYLGNHNINI